MVTVYYIIFNFKPFFKFIYDIDFCNIGFFNNKEK